MRCGIRNTRSYTLDGYTALLSWASMAEVNDSGLVVEAQRSTTFPSRPMRNFSDVMLGYFPSRCLCEELTVVPFDHFQSHQTGLLALEVSKVVSRQE